MFQNISLGSISFNSKHSVQQIHTSTLTDPISTLENNNQTEEYTTDACIQTEVCVREKTTKSKQLSEQDQEEKIKINAFLRDIGPLMLREMEKNTKTSGYYSKFEAYLEQVEEEPIVKLYELQLQVTDDTQDNSNSQSVPKLSCTGVSWNSTGSTVAVAYGRWDHSGWCSYRSQLCLWKIFHPQFSPTKPNYILPASSGLMCVAYHPKNPTVVAAGSYNGEVYVWDVENDDYRSYHSGIGDYFHREPVTKVSWVYDTQSDEYHIASCAGDGKILFWRLKDKLAYPVEGYLYNHPIPKSRSQVANAPPSTKKDNPFLVGCTALGFPVNDKSSRSFVVASEGGGLVRCFASKPVMRVSDFKGEKKWTATAARIIGRIQPSTRMQTIRKQVEMVANEKKMKEITLGLVYESKLDSTILYPSALDFTFLRHNGPIYDIQFSPYRSTTYLTVSSDGTARLYSTLQQNPIITFEVTPARAYLYAVAWSKIRPAVFAIACEDGNVYIYDLKASQVHPIGTLRGNEWISKNQKPLEKPSNGNIPIYAIDFNPRQRNFLATGDANGTVHIWKLSWQLANLQTSEHTIFETLEQNY